MKFLFAVSIGPVQNFIAAARRTADLYAGSQLLMEVAQKVARHLHQHGGQLIFPADVASEGANKILCEIETKQPRDLSQQIKSVCQDFLHEQWNEALGQLTSAQLQLVATHRAKVQLEHFLEVYCAWVPLQDYATDRKRVERLLASRKNIRDFAVFSQQDQGIEKSALDPAFASVVRFAAPLSQAPLFSFASEHLDTLSLLKRVRGYQLSRNKNGLQVLNTHALSQRAIDSTARNEDWEDRDDELQNVYFAILMADGDRMGEKISLQDNMEAHIELSRSLDLFAKDARTQVNAHHGMCVYAGGDDVLAFLPITTAFACAKHLSDAFAARVGGTLSVGLALVHYKVPLSQGLNHARQAERMAKQSGRARLTVALHSRSGAPVQVTAPWEDLRWHRWIKLYQEEKITRGVAHELLALARQWPDPHWEVEALKAEAQRIASRKQFCPDGLRQAIDAVQQGQDLEQLALELVVARFMTAQQEVTHA